MNYEYLPNLFKEVMVIYILIQLVILIKDKKGKYGYIINAIGLSIFIFHGVMQVTVIDQIVEGSLDFFLIMILGSIIEFIILLVSCICYKFRKSRVKNIKYFLVSVALFIIINYLTLFFVPSIIENIKHEKRVAIVKEHLKNTNGNIDFEIVDWGFQKGYEGIINTYVTGYFFEVKYKEIDKTFFVLMDEKNIVERDFFLELYHSDKLEMEYISKKDEYTNGYDTDFDQLEKYLEKEIEEKYNFESREYNLKDILATMSLTKDEKINSIEDILYSVLCIKEDVTY